MDLAVGIQTNGLFPGTLEALLSERLADKIAIDYKTRWEGYSGMADGRRTIQEDSDQASVRKSIAICKKALREDVLPEFEVVITVFYENEEYIREISKEVGTVPLVLQQGEHKIGHIYSAAPAMTNGEYIFKKRNLQEEHPPLQLDEIKKIADELGRTVRIRTREVGEISYESDWRRRASRKR